MNEISTVAASAHFVAGLTLVALAAMIWLRFGKRALRAGGGWALPVLPALAVAEWCQLPLVSPSAGQFVRLALLSLALVGMVEFALRFTGRRGGLLPRWSYLALVGLALVLFPWVGPTWLELGLRLTIAWQAIWLAASYSGLGEDAEPGRADGASRLAVPPGSLAGQAIIGGLLVGLLAAVVALPLVEMLALVVAAAAGYFGLSPIAVTPRSQLVWRYAWPAGFLLMAAGGCSLLAIRGGAETPTVALAQMVDAGASAQRQHSADDDPSVGHLEWEQAVSGVRETASSSMMNHARRLGLSLGPIALFIGVVWGLSRLPFMH